MSTPNELGARMFALEKALARVPAAATPESVVNEAIVFMRFLSAPSHEVLRTKSSIVRVPV